MKETENSVEPDKRPPQTLTRRNAVSDASTAEPLSNRFDAFPERKPSIHPDYEEEIIAEMRRNKNKALANVSLNESGEQDYDDGEGSEGESRK